MREESRVTPTENGNLEERVMIPEGEKGDGRVRFRVGDGRYVHHLQVIVCTCRQSYELAVSLYTHVL